MNTFVIGNSREKLMKALSLLSNFLIRSEDDYELILQKRVYKRTSEQNKRMWAILQEIAEHVDVQGVKYTAPTWHIYFKGRFIGFEEIRLPNEKVLEEPISTTTLDKGAFSDYMTQIEAWSAQHGLLLWEEAA